MKKVLIAVLMIGACLIVSTGVAMASFVNLMPGDDVASVAGAIPGSAFVTSTSETFNYYNALSDTRLDVVFHQEIRRAGSDGNLIYVYWLENLSTSNEGLSRLTTTSFGSVDTDVAYSSASISPTEFTRNGSGKTIGFEFAELAPGENSSYMWIKTSRPFYKGGNSSVENGGSHNVFSYAPSTVPEPTSMVLLSIGLLGAGAKLRKKFMA